MLYAQAIGYVLLNMLVLTPLIFAFSAQWFSILPHAFHVQVCQVLVGLVVHSVCYYAVHRAMHTPALYWCHRFHHRFNTHITPLAASNAATGQTLDLVLPCAPVLLRDQRSRPSLVVTDAVTPVEFSLAYGIPFSIFAKLLHAVGCAPDRPAVHAAIWLIGFTNLLIHTPWLEALAAAHVPVWLVSTADHFAHHKKLSMNYAAPTFNVDTAVRAVGVIDRALAWAFGKAYQEKHHDA